MPDKNFIWHSLFKGLINYLTTSLDTLLCPLIVTFSIEATIE